MHDLAVIILNYHSEADVNRQINTLISEGIERNVFYVLDNNTDDCKKLEISCENMGVYFHQMNSNHGYAHANNWAIKKGLSEGKKIFLILNPDIHISYNTIRQLYKRFHHTPEIGILGPRIRYVTNKELIFSDGGLLFPSKGFLGDHVNYHNLIGETNLKGLNYDIDYVNGSAMMFRSEILEEIGFMEEHLFMYYEESEWCYRLKKQSRKWKIAVDTSLSVYQTDSSRGEIYEYYMTRNRVWFCRKWNGKLRMLLKERYQTMKRIFRQKNLTRRQKRQFVSKILSGVIHGYAMKL